MNKSAVAVAAAIILGSFMALFDFTSAPSSNLLGANSTAILALTIVSVAVLATPSVKPGGKKARQNLDWARRTPMEETARRLRGASKGYTWDRKEIALTLRSAVDAKVVDETSLLPLEAVDAYLRSVLGEQSFNEFFSEDGWRATKVEASDDYLTRLRDVVTSLRQSLEF